MIKTKLAMFIASATLSLGANAGFIQYNLTDAGFDDGGTLTGYFVQNTDDQSIAYLDLTAAGGNLLGAQFFGSGLMSNIIAADTFYVGAGPTNFTAFNDQDTVYHMMNLKFYTSGTPGVYNVEGFHTETNYSQFGFGRYAFGTLTEGEIDPFLLQSLELGNEYVNRIVPDYIGPALVPEPGSLALMMLGVAGLAGAARRKRAAA